MVLVTGPTGSGKTTTLYAALAEINTTEKKIITVEDPVEYRLPGINQVQVNDKIDLSFERVLRSALRQDPDIVLVGEMRDQITAEIGMRAAITGHMVLSTLHTNDAASTPIRLLDMGVPRYMVAMSLQMVIAQRLVRVVCEQLRAAAHTPNPQSTNGCGSRSATRWIATNTARAPAARTATAPATGRTGIYEMLEMTAPGGRGGQPGGSGRFIRAAREQMAGHTLRRDAMRLVIEGRTTVQEAMRTTSQYED
jgi:MSHA biogenesis protein MshE